MRKVSVVRDFPPGCGQYAPHINLMSEDTEAVASLGDEENLVADEKKVNIADCVKTFEIGNESFSHQLVKSPEKSELPDSSGDLVQMPRVADEEVKGFQLYPVVKSLGSGLPKALENGAPELLKLHEVEVQAVVKTEGTPERKTVLNISSVVDWKIPAPGSKVDGMIPASLSKAWSPPQCPISDTHISKQTALENKYPRRRVSATRDFPPFCGRNSPCPTEEERLVIFLGNRTLGAPARGTVREKEEGSPLRETARVGVEKLDEKGKKRELKGSGPGPRPKTVFQKAAVQGGPAALSKARSPPQCPIGDTHISKQTALENKCPRRRVSATRDFPPFCGRNSPCPTEEERMVIVLGNRTLGAPVRGPVRAKEEGSPLRETARVGVEKLDEKGKKRELKGSGPGPRPKTVFQKAAVQGGPAALSKAWSPPQCPISDTHISKQTSLENKYPRRRVSATRDFPPFCGRNSPCPTEQERLAIVLGNRTLGAPVRGTVRANEEDCPLRETARVGVEKLDEKGKKRELKGSGPGPRPKTVFQKAAVQGGPPIKTVRTYAEAGSGRERAGAGAELDGYIRGGNAQKRKLEGPVPEPKTKYQQVIKENLQSRCPGGVALGHEEDIVIVQGLMAAADHPWKHGNGGGAANTSLDGIMTGNEVRRQDVGHVTWQEKSKSISRINVSEAHHLGRKSVKTMPPRKASYEIKHLLDVKDEGDFSVQQDEDTSAGQRLRDVKVILPPFGPNSSSHGTMRKKVREIMHLFQAICRKLLQREETKLKQQGSSSKRIDLQAAQIIQEIGKEVNTGKQVIGSVPGVEVGDEFQYRVELALVGVHRLYQGGIDYMEHGGMIVATSIVASGSYADDLENPDVLIYSGQGGNIVGRDKQPQDQKMERGNLALKNSITAKNPVRVIHGSKETKASTLDARAKIDLTYTYDGLYTVEKYWHDVGPRGQLVFMFELKRIPGQPEVAWKEVKKSNKFKIREGLCVSDISGGKEIYPICAVNTRDKGKPPKFNYISKMKYPSRYGPTPSKGCDCIGGCLDSQKCSCVLKNGGKFPYNYNGALVETKPLVYECGSSCKCPPSCYNRVSQHGIKIRLEIFKTRSRGWGVRSLTSIPSGSFICEYTGELLEDKEAEQRKNDEYLFDIGQNYNDWSLIRFSTREPDAQFSSGGVEEDGGFTIDAAQFGNVGRFINHSCSPNLYAQNVLYDHEDKRMPHIMLFAVENIPPLKELTCHYNYSVDQIQDSNGNIKRKSCYCGTAECTGRMY
ncbi:SU(VAR)3-9 homolog 5 [Actinidia rufa]|uniref:SU(VAR)3-9 homolog 5 n=1 Tax=Actinidia rufa TaxID=165716 RepID=A0A7J0FQV0_9ERIC|nr:SU(VAR)3-9 homolog 5 [Actinidia rufa]